MTHTSRATLLATLAACLLTGMFLTTSSASAGVATVYQCRGPQGQAATDLVSVSGSSAMVLSLEDCPRNPTWVVSSGAAG